MQPNNKPIIPCIKESTRFRHSHFISAQSPAARPQLTQNSERQTETSKTKNCLSSEKCTYYILYNRNCRKSRIQIALGMFDEGKYAE